MKTAFFVCLLTAQLSFAADSLIVNAGRNSRVIFYGKTPADLQNLERLDLNKLLRDLNQSKDTTAERIQMSAESYQATPKALPKWKQFWQDYKKNTFFNFHVGTGSYAFFQRPIGRYEYFRLTDPTIFMPDSPTKDYTFFNALWLRTRSVVGVSVVHDAHLMSGNRAGLKLRYGLGIEALGLRYEYANVIKTDLRGPDYELISSAKSTYFNSLRMTAYQTDVRAMSYNVQLMPKVFLKNKKGQETFSFGLGVRYNTSITRQPLISSLNGWGSYPMASDAVLGGGRSTFSQTPIVSSSDVFYSTEDAHVGSFTFMSEIGYKSIALFANYTPAFTQIKPNFRQNVSTNAQYFNQNAGNLGFFNFGVKFGR